MNIVNTLSLLNINILCVCIHVCVCAFYREAKQVIAMSLKLVQLKQ